MPIVVTNLFQTAYNLADTFWLGQYSTDALAAISFAFPMVFLLISLGMGISVVGSVLVAQYTGAGEAREAEYAASQTVTFAVIASVVLGGVGYFFVGEFLELMGASADVLPSRRATWRSSRSGSWPCSASRCFIALMRGYGDTITPMLVMFGSVVLNIALDPFLIFGWGRSPRLGIEGAAIATVFSRALALVVGLAIMFRGCGVRINVADMVPDASYLRRLLRIGLPASIEGTGRAVSMNLLLFNRRRAVPRPGRRRLRDRYAGVLRDFPPGDRGRPRRRDDDRPEHRVGQARPGRTGREPGGQDAIRGSLGRRRRRLPRPRADRLGVRRRGSGRRRPGGRGRLAVPPDRRADLRLHRHHARVHRELPRRGKTLTAAAISVLMLGVVRFPIAWVAAGRIGETGIWLSFAVSNVIGAVVASRGTAGEPGGRDLTDRSAAGDVDEPVVAAESTDD